VEALTKQNGVRLLGKFKKKVKTDLPYLSFYKTKPETLNKDNDNVFKYHSHAILKDNVNVE
jgi:hypothetical protein